MVPNRGPGLSLGRRLPGPGRTPEGDDQPWRGEDRAARDRRRLAPAPGRGGGGRLRHAAPVLGRGGRGRRGPQGRGLGEGADRLRPRAACGLQGAAQALHRGADPAHGDRQDPAPHGRRHAEPELTIAVVGAGAIGGFLGARLSHAGEDVILVARGPHLAAMREHGVTLRGASGELVAHPRCTDDMGAVAEASVVFITLKAHSIPAVAPMLGSALSPDAAVVGAMNGIPWWYFPDRHLESVDPGGVIARSIPYGQVVGCVVYPAATIVSPGVIEHEEGDRFSLGEPDGSRSQRVQRISAMLAAAGFRAPIQTRLRNEIWLKVIGNATLNPVSALTRTTLAGMLRSEGGRRLRSEER